MYNLTLFDYFVTNSETNLEYKNTKLINFLKTFSKDELSGFEKFLGTSYDKAGRNLLPFFNILKTFYPDYLSGDLNEKYIFAKLNPGSQYSDKKSKDILRTLSSSLFKAVEDFLYLSNIRSNKALKNRVILEEILKRNLSKHFEQYRDKADDELNRDTKVSGFNLQDMFNLEKLNSGYYSSVYNSEKYFRHNFRSFEIISVNFLLELFNNAKLILLSRDIRSISYGNNLLNTVLHSADLDKILKTFEDTPFHTILIFNYFIFRSLENNRNTEFYKKAKDIFFTNRDEISRHDKNYFYADLINLLQQGNTNLKSRAEKVELFSVIKACLEDKAYKLSDSDFMHPNFYRNTMLCAEYLKEFDWAAGFIEKYSSELNPEIRNNMKYYSMAFINYSKGEFERSLEDISKIKYDQAFFNTDVRVLMLRIYYELDLFEQAIYLTDSFKHYIKTSKNLNNEFKEAHRNYLNYYLKLFKLRSESIKNRKSECGLVRKQMKNEKFLIQRVWMNEKLDKIEAGPNK